MALSPSAAPSPHFAGKFSLAARALGAMMVLSPVAAKASTDLPPYGIIHFSRFAPKQDVVDFRNYNNCLGETVQKDLLPEDEQVALPPARNDDNRGELARSVVDSYDFIMDVQQKVREGMVFSLIPREKVFASTLGARKSCGDITPNGRQWLEELTRPLR